jgi:hypothetical protein
MAQRSRLRASDEDRDRIAEQLRHAAAEGRLLSEELEQRLSTALRARTYGELDSVVADLPGDRPSRRGGSRAPARRRPSPPSPLMLAGLALAIPVIIALVVAVAAVMLMLTIVWSVLALVTWRVVGHRHPLPSPWLFYTRHRRRSLTRGGAARGFAPWL